MLFIAIVKKCSSLIVSVPCPAGRGGRLLGAGYREEFNHGEVVKDDKTILRGRMQKEKIISLLQSPVSFAPPLLPLSRRILR
jgi:hypothetical protein